MKGKKKLLVSFSGGQTSGYMTKLLLDNLNRDEWDIVVVFANTGKEREETLEFVRDCDAHFGFNTVWVEAVVNPLHRKGTRHRVVTFDTAARDGQPFEDVIRKYGIPNVATPHCTRELKTNVITSYVRRELQWKGYYTAIGIRSDEIDRVDPKWEKKKYIYALITMFPSRRPEVNQFWINQVFRLKIANYEGNCDLCFKKTDRKLMTIILENPPCVGWWAQMGDRYGDFVPETRNQDTERPVRFYRQHRSIHDLVELAKLPFRKARDESRDIADAIQLDILSDLDLSNGCSDSCEPF